MSKVSVELTENVARAILGDIATGQTKTAYSGNKGWSWWAHDSSDLAYPFGSGVVTVVQRPYGTSEWERSEGDTEIVFEFMPDDADDATYFRVIGEYTSYSGDVWHDSSFKEVRPTKVVKRVFEAVK